MSNETQDETTAVEEAAVEKPEAGHETDWKSEARKWEQRAKQNREAAERGEEALKKLAEIEDAEKSETQRLQEQVEALTVERDAANLAALRSRVMAEFQVSPEDAELWLTSNDEDILRKQAERLAEMNRSRAPEAPNQGRGGGNSAVAAKSWAEALVKKANPSI